jgi:endoglucanase
MAGGACEASVFCAFGHAATCVCLPLGNYHNMADLAAVQAGTNTEKPTVGREYIAVSDYHGLVDLLLACCTDLADPVAANASSFRARIDSLWTDLKFVLDETARS